MNPKLYAIAKEAAENLQDLVKNHEEKILEAWHACEAEAQDQESAPKFKLALSITLDLERDQMETALSFGIRYKASRDQQIPDPAQTDLPLDTTVTISTEGVEPVTVTGEQFSKAARKLSGKL